VGHEIERRRHHGLTLRAYTNAVHIPTVLTFVLAEYARHNGHRPTRACGRNPSSVSLAGST
jgi:hypothetical protein